MLKPLILVLWIGGGDVGSIFITVIIYTKKNFKLDIIRSKRRRNMMKSDVNLDCQNKIICPLCGVIDNYCHVLECHSEYWVSKGMYNGYFPKTVDEFNNRFGIIGLYIKPDYL